MKNLKAENGKIFLKSYRKKDMKEAKPNVAKGTHISNQGMSTILILFWIKTLAFLKINSKFYTQNMRSMDQNGV